MSGVMQLIETIASPYAIGINRNRRGSPRQEGCGDTLG